MICPHCGKRINEPGTDPQNRGAHALMQECWSTGILSSPEDVVNFGQFRTWCKKVYGPPITTQIIGGEEYHIVKSWAFYTKKQRQSFIDLLLADIYQTGDLSKKMQEIIRGMNDY